MKLFFTILCLFNNFYNMNIILDHFPNLSDDQKNKFLELEKIYKFWNSKINVISRKDIDNILPPPKQPMPMDPATENILALS